MTLNEIIKQIKSYSIDEYAEVTKLMQEPVFAEDSNFWFQTMIEPKLNAIGKLFAQREAKADIAAVEKTQKTLTILLSELSNLLNLITVARLFSALSLHALRKQKNINDRVVITMTEKFTLVQLSSEKISYGVPILTGRKRTLRNSEIYN